MATDIERLSVQVDGQTYKFERAMARIEGRSAKAAANVERSFSGVQPRIDAAATNISRSLESAFGVTGVLGGAGLIAGGSLAGIITTLKETASSVADLAAEAQKAGIAFEPFQELKYAAQQARVGVDALTDGLKEMQLRADEFVRTGAGSSEEAFKRLGYTAADLKKKLADPAALFDEIIEKMKGFSKAAQIRIADEIFGGTGGEQFVRLMEQGRGAISKSRQEARELGVIIGDDLGKKARDISREFDKLALRIEVGLKTGVLEGAGALETYKAQIIAVAAAIGAVGAGITLGPFVASLGTAAAGAAVAAVGLTRLNATILAVAAAQRVAALASAGLTAALSLLGGPVGIAITALLGAIAYLALRQDQAKVSAEAHKKALAELDKVISEVQGRVPGALAELKRLSAQNLENARTALKAAESEYERQRALAAASPGVAAAAMTGGLPGWAVGGYLKERADAAEASLKRLQQAQKDLKEFQTKIDEAPQDYPKGKPDPALPGKSQEVIKSSQERVRSLENEAAALTMTKQAAAEFLFMQEAEAQARQANIVLTPQQMAQLEALARQYGEVTAAMEKTKEAQEQINELRSAASGFFSDLRSGLASGKSMAESFASAVGNLTEKLLDMLQNKLLMQLFNALPGFTSAGTVGNTTGASYSVNAATGGSIRGPGSGTSDSIPAMLSNGEYVIKAASAKRYGALLDAINSGRLRLPAFATGGPVGGPVARGAGGSGSPKVTVNNYAAADGYEARTQSGGINGERMIVSIVRKATARGDMDQAQRMRFGSGPRKNVRG